MPQHQPQQPHPVSSDTADFPVFLLPWLPATLCMPIAQWIPGGGAAHTTVTTSKSNPSIQTPIARPLIAWEILVRGARWLTGGELFNLRFQSHATRAVVLHAVWHGASQRIHIHLSLCDRSIICSCACATADRDWGISLAYRCHALCDRGPPPCVTRGLGQNRHPRLNKKRWQKSWHGTAG